MYDLSGPLNCMDSVLLHILKHPVINFFPAVKCSEFVFSRVSNLEQCLGMLGASLHNQPKSLPTFYEAWSTLVPPDIRMKHSPPSTPILVRHTSHNIPYFYANSTLCGHINSSERVTQVQAMAVDHYDRYLKVRIHV